MADVSVSIGVDGKEQSIGAFKEVGAAGQQLGETFGSIAGKLAGLSAGYLTVSGAGSTFNKVIEEGGKLSEHADQAGIFIDKLALLQRAFQNTGLAAEDVPGVINKMQKSLAGAGDESSAAAEKLRKLGIAQSDIVGKSPDEQFRVLAAAISKVQDPTERAADAMEFFGKSGGKTLALMLHFDEEMAKAGQEIGSYAEIMKKNAADLDVVGDGFGAITHKVVEFAAGLMDEAIPGMKTLIEYFKDFDATSMGQKFSETFSTGINIALSVFRDPGNLFIAFGDSLVLAFKTGINFLVDGIHYVWDFAANYFQAIAKDGIIDYMKSGLTAAFQFAASGLESMLAKIIDGIAGMLPEKWAGPMHEAANTLYQLSDEAGKSYEENLGKASAAMQGAFQSAVENTQFISSDFMDAASTADDLKTRMASAAASGKEILASMKESTEQAHQIAAAAGEYASKMAGVSANQSFNDWNNSGGGDMAMARGAGLKGAGNMDSPLRGSFPTAPADAAPRGGSSRPSVPAADPIKEGKYTQADSIYSNHTQKTSADFSDYLGYDTSHASKAQVIDDLHSQYLKDDPTLDPSTARKRAEDDYNNQFNKNLGPQAPGAAGNNGGSSSKANPPVDPSKVMADILEFVKKIHNDKLPVYALS